MKKQTIIISCDGDKLLKISLTQSRKQARVRH